MPRQIVMSLLAVAALARPAGATDDLQRGFAQPPASARPWVYWFPLSGNLTKKGITADLEAMERVGIGGVLYMEVDQGAPKGPADFAGPLWRELFRHACREADRLGLELNLNNDAGWCGSGGPWITPELSMQRVVWTETPVEGPARFDGTLSEPQPVRDFYRDVAVLAMPAPAGNSRIPNIQGKASFRSQHFPPQPARFRSLPPESVIRHEQIVELTERMGPGGKLAWDVPPGRWLILRLGHTTTGKDNHPAPESGRGLECDKFSKAAAEAHFNALVGRLVAENQPLAGQDKVFVSTHVDSWEVGSQNWTPRMREEFRQRRGYDLWPYLPVFTGRVVDSLEMSERFLWDLRQTVSDLIVENYAGHLRALANRHGLRLSIEAYGEPADDMAYAGQADEPMSEFWSWGKFGAAGSCTEMASAAHTYGKRILGAEAFTATNAEKWLGHPGNIKDLGDWAFCEGVNRFVFHRYAAQPWLSVAPGMSMGPWGLHYERTQTWWEQSKAWHEYLARCQYLLQQGLFVADVCYLQAEGAPRRFVPPPATSVAPYVRGGYNFDGCTPEVVLTRMSVAGGRIVLPDGMSYRVLVPPETLPDARRITNTFTIAAWVKPAADTLLPRQTGEGVTAFKTGRNDVVYPPPGHEVWGEGDAGAGFAVGRNGICVHEHGEDHFPAVLVYPAKVTGWTHVAVVYRDGTPSLYVGGKLVRTGLKSRFVVHPGLRVPHTRAVVPFRGQVADVQQFDRALGEAEIGKLAKAAPDPAAAGEQPVVELVRGEIWQPGTYAFKTADGRSREIKVKDLPAPVAIGGPWEVAFDPRWGGPEKVAFDKLQDWSKRPEEGIRYYSGTAVYRKTFHLDPATVGSAPGRFTFTSWRLWHQDDPLQPSGLLGPVTLQAALRFRLQPEVE